MRPCLGPWEVIPRCISYNPSVGHHRVASPCADPGRLNAGGDSSTAPIPLRPPGSRREGCGSGLSAAGPSGLPSLWPLRLGPTGCQRLRGRLAEERRLLAALPRRRRAVRAQHQAYLQQTVGTPADLGAAARWAPLGTTGALPPARRRVGHAAWLRPDGALRAAALVTAAPGRQARFGEKPGKETPHPGRAGETSPSAGGSGGLRPPRAPWPMPQQAGGPAGHGPAPVPGLFPPTRGLMSFCQGIVWSEFQLYMAKSLCELSLWMKMLWSGYYTSTFLRSNSLGQYIL